VPFKGNLITSDLALVTWAWAGRQLPGGGGKREDNWFMPGQYAVGSSGQALTMAGIFSARAWEAGRMIEAGRGGVLLAEPETERGTISARTLLERVRELGTGPGTAGKHDQDVALLRLAPGEAGELWSAWAPVAGTTAGALRETHQIIQSPLTFAPVTGEPAGEPIRASQRWHNHMLAQITGQVPAAPGCRSWQLLTRLTDPLQDHEVLADPSRFDLRHYDAAVAGWSLICPWQPELSAAHLLRPLSDGLIPGRTPASTALASIRHPGHPLGPVGHLALVTGLASAEADTRIAAAQLWTEASADGRLCPELAADAIVAGVTGRALMLSRIADALQHASQTPLAARRVVETVCAGAAGLPIAPNLHRLIELAARLGARVGVPELPAAVSDLAARRGSRLAATAAQLVKTGDAAAPDRDLAAVEALEALVSRAEARP
jgi:hypothetical protein